MIRSMPGGWSGNCLADPDDASDDDSMIDGAITELERVSFALSLFEGVRFTQPNNLEPRPSFPCSSPPPACVPGVLLFEDDGSCSLACPAFPRPNCNNDRAVIRPKSIRIE